MPNTLCIKHHSSLIRPVFTIYSWYSLNNQIVGLNLRLLIYNKDKNRRFIDTVWICHRIVLQFVLFQQTNFINKSHKSRAWWLWERPLSCGNTRRLLSRSAVGYLGHMPYVLRNCLVIFFLNRNFKLTQGIHPFYVVISLHFRTRNLFQRNNKIFTVYMFIPPVWSYGKQSSTLEQGTYVGSVMICYVGIIYRSALIALEQVSTLEQRHLYSIFGNWYVSKHLTNDLQ